MLYAALNRSRTVDIIRHTWPHETGNFQRELSIVAGYGFHHWFMLLSEPEYNLLPGHLAVSIQTPLDYSRSNYSDTSLLSVQQ